jgi:hypothetical protein
MRRLSWLVLVLASCWGGVARADWVASTPPGASEPEWYGWQILLADSAAVIVGTRAPGFGANAGEVELAVIAMYLVAAPVIHKAHDRGDATVVSMALRFFAVPMAALIGDTVGAQSCAPPPNADVRTSCEVTGATSRLALGVAGVSIFDATRAWTRPVSDRGLDLAPYVTPGGTGPGTVVGIVGRF